MTIEEIEFKECYKNPRTESKNRLISNRTGVFCFGGDAAS
jgi:hypothetical protein